MATAGTVKMQRHGRARPIGNGVSGLKWTPDERSVCFAEGWFVDFWVSSIAGVGERGRERRTGGGGEIPPNGGFGDCHCEQSAIIIDQ